MIAGPRLGRCLRRVDAQSVRTATIPSQPVRPPARGQAVRVAREVEHAGELALGHGQYAEAYLKLIGHLLGGERSPAPITAGASQGNHRACGPYHRRAAAHETRHMTLARFDLKRGISLQQHALERARTNVQHRQRSAARAGPGRAHKPPGIPAPGADRTASGFVRPRTRVRLPPGRPNLRGSEARRRYGRIHRY